jgi:hypothetical protein
MAGGLTNKTSYCHIALIMYVRITKIMYVNSRFDTWGSLGQW